MGIDVAARRKLESARKLADLNAVFKVWKEAAEGDLKTHRSQVLAAYQTLLPILEKLETLDPVKMPGAYGRLLLSAHRVWDFFRVKFAQRTKSKSKVFLDIADQLAYDCYKPVVDIAKKAPPLVVLTGASQPYVQKRESPFSVEGVATQEGLEKDAVRATAQLPFPIIGLPWWQPANPAGLLAIAHEVGHAVEDDLGLGDTLQSMFDTKDEQAVSWKRWQRELFADTWGCLCCGPAFAFSLADHIASATKWEEPLTPGSPYPPAWLRVRYSFAVLKALNKNKSFGQDEDDRIAKWKDWYSFQAKHAELVGPAEAVAGRLVAATLPGLGKLLDMNLLFDGAKHKDAIAQSKRWSFPPAAVLTREKRMPVALAAYRLAYEADPERISAKPFEEIAKTLNDAVDTGYRSKTPDHPEAHKARGQALLNLLGEE